MKNRILIFGSLIIASGLTAFNFMGYSNPIKTVSEKPCKQAYVSATPVTDIFKPPVKPNFSYHYGPRFNPISKSDLAKARTVSDFIDENEVINKDGVLSTTVIVIENDIQTDKRIFGKGEKLNKKQLAFIQAMDYSTNFSIRAEFHTNDAQVAMKGENIYYPHMTVVPEKQAFYSGGKNGLLDFLRERNEKNIYDLDEKKLQPAKLRFTVTKNGEIESIELYKSCGYPKVDNAMIKLANNLPGHWEPAENSKGEKVDQVLVISFGTVGC